MKLALLTPAIGSHNAGDAMIESAIRRLVPADSHVRFSIRRPLTEEEMRVLNSCDAAILCGSNIYQNRLRCALDQRFLDQLRIPLIPLGMGASAATGDIPRMRAEDADIVRGLHSRCAQSSVRDEATLRFLHGLGIENVRLTGCPVLFHGLKKPEIQIGESGPVTVSLRQTFLHGAEPLEGRQEALLEALCQKHHPTIITQGPADLAQAHRLVWEHDLDHVFDQDHSDEVFEWFAQHQAWTGGFRLHFGMLSLAYGRPAWFVGHDSRVEGFCLLMGLPYLDVREATLADVLSWGPQRMGDFAGFGERWAALAAEMRAVLEANGLPCALEAPLPGKKPRVLFMVPRREWAYDFSALSILRRLEPKYDIRVRYSTDDPMLRPEPYDLALVFYWAETAHRQRGFDPNRVIEYVSSHRWQYPGKHGPLSVHDFIWRHLSQAGTILTTSLRLLNLLRDECPRVFHAPNGFETARFHRTRERTGPLSIGAAGFQGDSVKGYGEILVPAAHGHQFELAQGTMNHEAMNEFYNRFDVIAVTSAHEGEPLTLIEAMAAGCFPVCTDVGIVPELVRDRENGYIVKERTIAAFREAFDWCEANIELVRNAGRQNAELLRETRTWERIMPGFSERLEEVLAWASRPRFVVETSLSADDPSVKKLHRLLARFRQSVVCTPVADEPLIELADDLRRHREAGRSWQMLPGHCYRLYLMNESGPHDLGWEALEKALRQALLPAPPVRWPLLARLRRYMIRQLTRWH
jgi:Glycosyl transferases group 1/Polysaccharide pyruvyl transferase